MSVSNVISASSSSGDNLCSAACPKEIVTMDSVPGPSSSCGVIGDVDDANHIVSSTTAEHEAGASKPTAATTTSDGSLEASSSSDVASNNAKRTTSRGDRRRGRRQSAQRQRSRSETSRQLPIGRMMPLLMPNISPETSLIEFISTSAAYHNVQRTTIRDLEADLLTVFPHNIMPANAAAWYMAKRRFYTNSLQSGQYQLLATLLREYPHKFLVSGNIVQFLEAYSTEVARKKLSSLIHQGLMAYFAHKADEYGIYFFDPYYYESTEPFISNLLHTLSSAGYRRNARNVIQRYFVANNDVFHFKELSPYLVAIAKQPLRPQIMVNVTCVITAVVDGANGAKYGILKFAASDRSVVGHDDDETGNSSNDAKRRSRTNINHVEKALFPLRALYRDGFIYPGDPLKLSAVEFDGYRIPMARVVRRRNSSASRAKKGSSKMEPMENSLADCTWFAALVWCGRKPSPRFSASKEELLGGFDADHLTKLDANFVAGTFAQSVNSGFSSTGGNIAGVHAIGGAGHARSRSSSVSRAPTHTQTRGQCGSAGGSVANRDNSNGGSTVTVATASGHDIEMSLFISPQRQPLLSASMVIGQVVKIVQGGAIVSTDLTLTGRAAAKLAKLTNVDHKGDSGQSHASSKKALLSSELGDESGKASTADDSGHADEGTEAELKDVAAISGSTLNSEPDYTATDKAVAKKRSGGDGATDVPQMGRYFLPGWMHQQRNNGKHRFLTTRQGVELAVMDAVAFEVEKVSGGTSAAGGRGNDTRANTRSHRDMVGHVRYKTQYVGIGYNVIVLRCGNPGGSVISKKLRKSSTTTSSNTIKTGDKSGLRRLHRAAPKMKRPRIPMFVRFLVERDLADSDIDSDTDSTFDPATAFDPVEFDAEFDNCSDTEISDDEIQQLANDPGNPVELAKLAVAIGTHQRRSSIPPDLVSSVNRDNGDGSNVAVATTKGATATAEAGGATATSLLSQVDKLIETVGGMTMSGSSANNTAAGSV